MKRLFVIILPFFIWILAAMLEKEPLPEEEDDDWADSPAIFYPGQLRLYTINGTRWLGYFADTTTANKILIFHLPGVGVCNNGCGTDSSSAAGEAVGRQFTEGGTGSQAPFNGIQPMPGGGDARFVVMIMLNNRGCNTNAIDTMIHYAFRYFKVDTADGKVGVIGYSQGGQDFEKVYSNFGIANCGTPANWRYKAKIKKRYDIATGTVQQNSSYADGWRPNQWRGIVAQNDATSGILTTIRKLQDSMNNYINPPYWQYTELVTGGHTLPMTDSALSRYGSSASNNIWIWFADASATGGTPVADAGPNQTITLPTNSANVSGGASYDPNGTITGYAWSKVSGTGGAITNANQSNTAITGLSAGTYVYRLQVTDNSSNTAIDDITITVNPSGTTTYKVTPRSRTVIDFNGRRGKSFLGLLYGGGLQLSPVNEDVFCLPFKSIVFLDSVYKLVTITYRDSSGTNPGLRVVVGKRNNTQMLFTDWRGTLNTVDSLATDTTNTSSSGLTRTMDFTGIDSISWIMIKAADHNQLTAGVFNFQIFGIAIDTATNIFPPPMTVSYPDQGFKGTGMHFWEDMNKDSIKTQAEAWRIGEGGWWLDYDTDNWDSALVANGFPYNFGRFGGNNGWKNRIGDFKLQYDIFIDRYFRGGNVKNIPRATVSGGFNYGSWSAANVWKYIEPGADTTLAITWAGRGKWKAIYQKYYGNNTSANISWYRVVNMTGGAGQATVDVQEDENEHTMDWNGTKGHWAPNIMYLALQVCYDSIMAANPNAVIAKGAMTFLDSAYEKALYGWQYCIYGRNKTPPWHIENLNLYMNSEYDGQSTNPPLVGLHPYKWRLSERFSAFTALVKVLFGKPYQRTEGGYANNSGSSYEVPTISGKTFEETKGDWWLIDDAECQSVPGLVRNFYYSFVGDGSGTFDGMAANTNNFNGGGAYIGTTPRAVGYLMGQKKALWKYGGYMWKNTKTVYGDSTGITVYRWSHSTDPNKAIIGVVKGTQTNSTTVGYVLNLLGTATTAKIWTLSYTSYTPTSVSGTIIGNTTTLDVNEKMKFIEVTYNNANQAPTAEARGPANEDAVVTTGTSVQIDAISSSDPDGTIASYLWEKVSGPAGGAISASTSSVTDITSLIVGVYTYRLTVTDDDGATDTDILTITVNIGAPPTISSKVLKQRRIIRQ